MGTKYLTIMAVYKEMSGLAVTDPTGISAAVVILIGAALITKILISE